MEGCTFAINDDNAELNFLDKIVLMYLHQQDFPKSTKEIMQRFIPITSPQTIRRTIHYLRKSFLIEEINLGNKVADRKKHSSYWVMKPRGVQRLTDIYKHMTDAMYKNAMK
jgi:Fe2+ or Zn2+ uptake regulation protein